MSAAFSTWQVGAARITKVEDLGSVPLPPEMLFHGVTPAQVLRHAWLRPRFATAEGKLRLSIHAFIIESEGQRIIVDTCVGNDKPRAVAAWNMRRGSFLEDMNAAGFPPESIDRVLCTHMHADHVGWNTRQIDGRWVPTFPNARYLFAQREWEHFASKPRKPAGDVMGDSIQPVLQAGLADFVETNHKLTSEVSIFPTPGHTPGHVSVRIVSAGQEAVITGDVLHHPLQCCEPDLSSNFDFAPERARHTRRDFLARHANRQVLVLGTHFAAPTAGWLVSKGSAWQLTDCPPGKTEQ